MPTMHVCSPTSRPERRPLGALAEIFVGLSVRASTRDDGSHQVRRLGLADLVDGRLRDAGAGADWVNLDAEEAVRFTLREGDVLVAARGSQAKVALVTAQALPAVASANLLVVRPGPSLLPGVAFAFLRSGAGTALITELSRSTANQLSISARDIAGLEVPVPPMDVQASIHALVVAGEVAYSAALAAAAERRAAVQAIALNMIRNTTKH